MCSMKDSIVVNMDYAGYDIIDGTPTVERHHIFEGVANRPKSDEDGLWVPLSYEHHQGNMSVHHNKEMKALMHIIGQLAYEKDYIVKTGLSEKDARESFRKRYGRSFL